MNRGRTTEDNRRTPPPRPGTASVVPHLYEAAVQPSAWGDALKATAELLQATAVMLQRGPPSARKIRITAASGLVAELVATYNREHVGDDELVRELLAQPAGVVVSSRLALGGPALERSSVYRNLMRPADLTEMAGVSFVKERDLFAGLWMARGPGCPAFTETDYCALRELLPHLERVVVVNSRVTQAQQLAELTAGAFDRVAMGVVLLDALGRPLLTNREARRIVAEADGFAILEDGPAATRHDETRTLRATIRSVGGDDHGPGSSRGRALRLSRPSGRADYQVVVVPLPRRCQPEDGVGVVAVLFVSDPERSDQIVDYMLGNLFGLTEAEVRLVTRLLAGSTLTDAAETLGLSRNTVHSQLASVFRKTGTRRQSELVKLVVQGLATVRGPDEGSGGYSALRGERK